MAIDRFRGGFRFLSNFEIVPDGVELDGYRYATVEHAYQAAKTLDAQQREDIRLAPTAAVAKRLGRRADLRPDWDAIKIDVMHRLLWQKFQDPLLRTQLLATADVELIEGNDWGDRFWGCTYGGHDRGWVGENHLGKLLMALREEIRKGVISAETL